MRSLTLVLLFAAALIAQPPASTLPNPRLLSVFPCGGKSGAVVEVTVRGVDLDDPQKLIFSKDGFESVVVKPEPPKDAKKPPPPGPLKFKVAIPEKIAGAFDVRFVGKHGVSNPRTFFVGSVEVEKTETEPNNDVPQAMSVERGQAVYGAIDSQTDVDYYKLAGKKGESLLIHCAAGSVDSRARPFVECFAPDGKTRIALNHDYDGTDALMEVKFPADGEYYVRVTEFAYTAGGPDYYYRLMFGTQKWIDYVFPPVLQPTLNAQGHTRLYYRHFAIGDKTPTSVPFGMKFDDSIGFSGTMNRPQSMGLLDGMAFRDSENSCNIFYAAAPVVLEESGDNDAPAKAQSVKAPCEIAGRIDVRYDRDSYKFAAKKNEPLMIELFGERIGTTMDGVLTIKDATGKEIAGEQTLDDDPESLHPTSFFTRTTDPPPYKFIPPADGEYTVTVSARDANANYGPKTIYRLRVAPPKPDFRAVAMARNREGPMGVNCIPAGETAIDVFVHRLDGFTAPVTAKIENLPPGVTAKPAVIGTGQKWGMIVLTSAAKLESAESKVKVTCTAAIDGKEVARPASTASILWNVPNANNSPTLARLDRGMIVAARPGEKAPYRIAAKLDKATIRGSDGKERPAEKLLAVKPGEKITLPVSVTWQGEGARPNVVNVATEPTLSMQGASAVAANNNQPIPIPKEKTEQTITLDVRPNIAPGLYHVMLRGDTRAPMIADAMTKAKKEFTILAFAEPFTVKVLPVSLGRLTAQMSGPVKRGQSATLTVRVERAFNFSGEFPVKIAFPPNSGLSAGDTAIPENSNEVKIAVMAAKDAKPGNVNNVPVEATATFDGDTVTHKLLFNCTVVK